MKLNPLQAPLYGGCLLTVQLDDEEACRRDEDEEEEEFYLLFSGSMQRHLSSTLRVSRATLQAVCPAHTLCEPVLVTLCVARPHGAVDARSQESFSFIQDLALDMAHFLLDGSDPQEALMLEDQQVMLKKCERLDQSLTLALKHVSSPPFRTPSGGGATPTQSELDAQSRPDISSNPDETRVQRLSSLLHLAARHGLTAVASFALQQTGGQEALRRPNARGETAAGEARRRGHEELVQLFTRYETSSPVVHEPQEHLVIYPECRVFQRHSDLGTYTLTLPMLHQRQEGAETKSQGPLQEEVEELRRLIHLHRDTKGTPAGRGHRDSELFGPTPGLQACSDNKQEVGEGAVTIETSVTTTEENAAVTQTSCHGGRVCQKQEEEVKAPAVGGRNRKHKKKRKNSQEERKRRAKGDRGGGQVSETSGNTGGTTVPIIPENTGGTTVPIIPENTGGTTVPIIPENTGGTTVPVIPENTGGTTVPIFLENTGGTTVPIIPGDSHAVAVPTTAIVEKQEAENGEVEQLMCEQRNREGRRQTNDLRSADQTTETMGQEQSQDHQESQSDPEGQSSPGAKTSPSPTSPGSQRKPRRVLWRDGGWISSRMGPGLNNEDLEPKSVWYQAEELVPKTAGYQSKDPEAKTVWYQAEDLQRDSQTVWYDSDSVDPRDQGQLDQSEDRAESRQSQPHAAGPQPAPSHDPAAAQRQEEQASERGEEAGRERGTSQGRSEEEDRDGKSRRKRRKKRGRRGGDDKLSSSSSFESPSLTESLSPTECPGLSESPRPPETDPNTEERDQTGWAAAPVTATREEAEQDAMTLPGQTEGQRGDKHRPDCRVSRSDPGFISVMEDQGTDQTTGTPLKTLLTQDESVDPESSETRSAGAAAERPETRTTDGWGQEVLELELVRHEDQDQQSRQDSEMKTEDQDVTVQSSVEQTDSNGPGRSTDLQGRPGYPEERPGDPEERPGDPEERPGDPEERPGDPEERPGDPEERPGDPEERPGDPEERPGDPEGRPGDPEERPGDPEERPGDPEGRPGDPEGEAVGFMDLERPSENDPLPCGGTADVSSLLLSGEGSAGTAPVEYSEHCLDSEMLRGQQQAEEETEEVGEERGWTEERDLSVVQTEDLTLDPEQKYNEELAAAAIAVVTVAVASAMASVEMSQWLADNRAQSEETSRPEKPDQGKDAETVAPELALVQENELRSQTQEQPGAALFSNKYVSDTSSLQKHVKEGSKTNLTRPVGGEKTPQDEQKPKIQKKEAQITQNHLFTLGSQRLEEDGVLLDQPKPSQDTKDKVPAKVDSQTETGPKVGVEASSLTLFGDEGNPTQETHPCLVSSRPVGVDDIPRSNQRPLTEPKDRREDNQTAQNDLLKLGSRPADEHRAMRDTQRALPETKHEITAQVDGQTDTEVPQAQVDGQTDTEVPQAQVDGQTDSQPQVDTDSPGLTVPDSEGNQTLGLDQFISSLMTAEEDRVPRDDLRPLADEDRVPGEDLKPLADEDRVPGEDLRPLADEDRVPGEDLRPLADEDRVPGEDLRPLADEDRVPGEDLRPSADEDRVPGDDLRPSADEDRVPGDDLRPSADEDRVPGEDLRPLADEDRVPGEDLRPSADEDRVPGDDLRPSADEDRVPGDDLRPSADEDRVPGEDLRPLADEDRVPGEDLRPSADEDRVPGEDLRPSADEDRVPGEDLRPLAEDKDEGTAEGDSQTGIQELSSLGRHLDQHPEGLGKGGKDPQLDDQIKHEAVRPSVLVSVPVPDSTCQDEPALKEALSDHQTSLSLSDVKDGKDGVDAEGSDGLDLNTIDTVDGWKERERTKEREEGRRGPSQTGAERSSQSRTEQDALKDPQPDCSPPSGLRVTDPGAGWFF
ncbi:uncharacterized protein LOC121515446 isoform X2 [Cheilinus undulatus]|nr:uncharacterized protein LOC121515446 isoform X2 [Cheilinus undulatus]